MADQPKILTQYQIVADWLKYTIADLKKAMEKKRISDARNNLLESIQGNLVYANPTNISKIVLKFLKHGRFVDMGVGRGVPIGSQAKKHDFYKKRYTENTATTKREQLREYNRKPKKWYSTTMPGKEKDLTKLLLDNFGIETVQFLEKSIREDIEIKF